MAARLHRHSKKPKRPNRSVQASGINAQTIIATNVVVGTQQIFSDAPASPKPLPSREFFLQSLLADHSSFMRDRLSSFVGRVQDLEKIRQRIEEKMQTGGYVTITGQAGQGKSSIIAKFVEEYGSENVAFHFIPFNPGPDHQVGLLRNLMARLILKYKLSDLYVASDRRAALRDYFPKVLGELVSHGGQEVIFIDGLDQLEAEQSGERDLSFLPNDPPPGVVFVLGTRPNDTLRPLELLKPRYEYWLPNLSREDFDLILDHRQVRLERDVADQFYRAMQGNALYLDLVAKELTEHGVADPQVLIKQLAQNPEHLFSLAMTRFKYQSIQWQEVIKPALGVLLVAREPLGLRHIRQIIEIDDDRLKEGIERLGGLIVQDWRQRYSLFHLKLYEYLRQDEQRPTKEYIFAIDEEENWHKRLAHWCEQNHLPTIWQDAKHDTIEQGRREYARKYYLTHLYHAHEWERLFTVLDTTEYGQAKVREDPSTRSYAQDVDLGRRAAEWIGWSVEEGIALLPRLWQYTLLRNSLRSRADQYPLEAFQFLMAVHRNQEAFGLAELLTNPVYKTQILQQIAEQVREQDGQETEWFELFMRASNTAEMIKDSDIRTNALRKLGITLAQMQQWDYAESAIRSIKQSDTRAIVLGELAVQLAKAKQLERAGGIWTEAEMQIRSIEERSVRDKALSELGVQLAQAQQWEEAERVIRSIEGRDNQAKARSELAAQLAQAQRWEQAKGTIYSLKFNSTRVKALSGLGTALAQAQQWEWARRVWKEAESIIRLIEDKDEALRELGRALMQAQQWEEAERLIRSIAGRYTQTRTMRELSVRLAQDQQWKQAERVIFFMVDGNTLARALGELAAKIKRAGEYEHLLRLIQRTWRQDRTREDILNLFSPATEFIYLRPEIGIRLFEAFTWVDKFFKG